MPPSQIRANHKWHRLISQLSSSAPLCPRPTPLVYGHFKLLDHSGGYIKRLVHLYKRQPPLSMPPSLCQTFRSSIFRYPSQLEFVQSSITGGTGCVQLNTQLYLDTSKAVRCPYCCRLMPAVFSATLRRQAATARRHDRCHYYLGMSQAQHLHYMIDNRYHVTACRVFLA